MLPNALAATLRHLNRNRLQACVTVGGLALGLGIALVAALVIRSEYSFDHDVPAYRRTYVNVGRFQPPGLAAQYVPLSPVTMAATLKARFPEVEAVSRAADRTHRVRHGERDSREQVYWADPNFFDLLPPRIVAGNPAAALQSADGVVLTRNMARNFFGRDAPLDEELLIDDHPMTVRAVIEPPLTRRTHVERQIIASALAAFSAIRTAESPDAEKFDGVAIMPGLTYVRLRPGAAPTAVLQAVSELTRPRTGPQMFRQELVRLDRYHAHEGLNPGFSRRMSVLALLGAVILAVAAINFVNLQIALSPQRFREVAIRRLAGASRGRILAQLLLEALCYAIAATVLAVAFAEGSLPQVNAFLDTGATLDYAGDLRLVLAAGAICVLLGVSAGIWPAVAVSGTRPLAILHGASIAVSRAGRCRQLLVATQFALLVGLAICAGVAFLQRSFAIHDALPLDRDLVVMISTEPDVALTDRIRALPGVRALSRAESTFLGSTGFRSKRGGIQAVSVGTTRTPSGKEVSLHTYGVDFDLFAFYGVAPLAGRLPPADGSYRPEPGSVVVLNETAVRRFELGTPRQAIGKTIDSGMKGAMVVAVVPDFSLSPVQEVIPPIAYVQTKDDKADLLNVRLSGHDIPGTLAAIDAAWRETGNNRALGQTGPLRFFLDEHVESHYVSVLRQSEAFGICALIAIALSCIGLFALAAALAERRTREIGLRKALGAHTSAVARLLLWQSTRPVIWGILIAWPVAAWLMHRWLQGFAYRIDLPVWPFPLAAIAALLIAVSTVVAHTLAVARTRPTSALRHE